MPELRAELSGHTAWEVLDGDAVVASGEWHNLILNSGLDSFGTTSPIPSTGSPDSFSPIFGYWRSYLALGTGSAAPDVTQTVLGQEVARTASNGGFHGEITSTYSGAPTTMTAVGKQVRVHTFTSAYNITEYGLSPNGTANSTLAIRELFRDANGNPVVLSVQAGQKIKLTHTLTVTLPLGFVDTTLTIPGVGAATGRVLPNGDPDDSVTGKASFYKTGETRYESLFAYVFGFAGSGQGSAFTSADSFNPGAAPPIPNNVFNQASVTELPYVLGSYKRVKRMVFDVASANYDHYGWLLSYSILASEIGFRFGLVSPAKIPKTDTKKLTLDWEMSWGRA